MRRGRAGYIASTIWGSWSPNSVTSPVRWQYGTGLPRSLAAAVRSTSSRRCHAAMPQCMVATPETPRMASFQTVIDGITTPAPWWLEDRMAQAQLGQGLAARLLDDHELAITRLETARSTLERLSQLNQDVEHRQRLTAAELALASSLCQTRRPEAQERAGPLFRPCRVVVSGRRPWLRQASGRTRSSSPGLQSGPVSGIVSLSFHGCDRYVVHSTPAALARADVGITRVTPQKFSAFFLDRPAELLEARLAQARGAILAPPRFDRPPGRRRGRRALHPPERCTRCCEAPIGLVRAVARGEHVQRGLALVRGGWRALCQREQRDRDQAASSWPERCPRKRY